MPKIGLNEKITRWIFSDRDFEARQVPGFKRRHAKKVYRIYGNKYGILNLN